MLGFTEAGSSDERTALGLCEGLQDLCQAAHPASLLAHALHLGLSLSDNACCLLIHLRQLALMPRLALGLGSLSILQRDAVIKIITYPDFPGPSHVVQGRATCLTMSGLLLS